MAAYPNAETDTLDDLLDQISVDETEDTPFGAHLPGWYGVHVDGSEGIIAYFFHKKDAYRFRLSLINDRLNSRNIGRESE